MSSHHQEPGRETMFVLLFGSILVSYFSIVATNETRWWILKPNVIVVDVEPGRFRGAVPLVCGEAYDGDNITWINHKNEVLEKEGNRVDVLVEGWMGGNFSCFGKDRSFLNHTLVLAKWNYRKIITDTPEKGYIHCSTNNYSGSFQCFWTWDKNREGSGSVVHIEATRSGGGGTISCSVESSGESITCWDEDYCPYAEELEHIHLRVFFRSSFVLEEHNKHFHISEIVRPDVVTLHKLNHSLVQIAYPPSWNTPSSYFPLTFHVKQIRLGPQKRQETSRPCESSRPRSPEVFLTSGENLEMRSSTVCVRARDEFCGSSWSEWSHFTTKRKQKGLKTKSPWRLTVAPHHHPEC